MLNKKDFRQQIKNLNKSNKTTNFDKEDTIIIKKLMSSPPFYKAKTILLYYPLSNEVNTINLINECIKLNKVVALPKTYENSLKFVILESNWNTKLKKGLYNTTEVESKNYINTFDINTIIIVPALAYGKDNSRIGHGKGYYDKFLSDKKDLYKIGLARKHLLFDTVPTNKNDIYLDKIITSI